VPDVAKFIEGPEFFQPADLSSMLENVTSVRKRAFGNAKKHHGVTFQNLRGGKRLRFY
jgi:hypothetical protein